MKKTIGIIASFMAFLSIVDARLRTFPSESTSWEWMTAVRKGLPLRRLQFLGVSNRQSCQHLRANLVGEGEVLPCRPTIRRPR